MLCLCVFQEKVIPCLLRLKQAGDPGLRAAVGEALALVGYHKPVKGRGIRILSIDGGGLRYQLSVLCFSPVTYASLTLCQSGVGFVGKAVSQQISLMWKVCKICICVLFVFVFLVIIVIICSLCMSVLSGDFLHFRRYKSWKP